ncbi:MAG: sarcosine oxidase subunit gamma family protein [Pseudomonadota bacterium]
MSNVVSALPGAAYADGIAEVREAGLTGMVTLRGDLADKKLVKAVKAHAGAMPGQRGIAMKGGNGAAWMSPDELLLICDHGAAGDLIAALGTSLAGTHYLAVNVSDARAVFTVSGARAGEVLAKLMPVDFSTFGMGEIRRSRMAQIPAAVWRSGEAEFTVVCFRSVAQYAFDVLKVAAQPGSEVF